MVGRSEEREPVRRLLLVEDDPGDAFLVGELIAEVDPDLAVTVAGSMPEALPQLADSDCVLLDLNLPGYAGLDGLHTLLGADPLAAVCVLTGLDDEHLGTDAVAAGAQDYLVKGKVDGPLLIRAIRYAVERRRAETSLLRLREEQLVAAESSRLERGLLPSPLLAGSDVHSVTFYRAGRTRAVLGGDFFDAVRDADGTVHAIIGDVSGHGPDEAALGALLRVSWRALVLAGVGEERLLPELQRLLVSERHDSRLFTTACMITISGGVAVVRVAGHPPPVALWSVDHAHPAGRPAARGRGERVLARADLRTATQLGVAALHRRPHRGPRARQRRFPLDRRPAGDAQRRPRHRARRAARPARRTRGGLQRRTAARRRRHPAAGRSLMLPDPAKRWTLRRIFTFGAACAALITIGAIALGTAALLRLSDARFLLLDQVGPAVLAAQNLPGDLVDQETAVRGFVIGGGNAAFLDPYMQGRAAEDRDVAAIRGYLASARRPDGRRGSRGGGGGRRRLADRVRAAAARPRTHGARPRPGQGALRRRPEHDLPAAGRPQRRADGGAATASPPRRPGWRGWGSGSP